MTCWLLKERHMRLHSMFSRLLVGEGCDKKCERRCCCCWKRLFGCFLNFSLKINVRANAFESQCFVHGIFDSAQQRETLSCLMCQKFVTFFDEILMGHNVGMH